MATNDYTTIPLSWNDPLFSDNANSGPVTLPRGGTLSNKSITETGSLASVLLNGAATLNDMRISSREGVRIGGSGNVTINDVYIETTGQSGDHADGIQAYSPGSTGTVTVTNSTIVSHNNDTTAGFWVSQNYTGTFIFENVVFQGGPFGLRIHADVGGDQYVSLKDVYFVGPFMYDPFYFLDYGGHEVHITQWENVRYATIANGVLVPGALIPPPSNVTVDPGASDGTPTIVPTIASFSTDSNVVDDRITNDDTLSLNGTAPANSTVRVYDGTTPIGSTTANSSGAWSYTTAPLTDGTHDFTVSAGGTTSSSSALTVTVDTVAPSAPTIDSFSTDTAPLGDGVTSDNTLTLTGAARADSAVTVYDGETLLGQTTANSSEVWSYTTGPLSNGPHSFTASRMDTAGNEAASAALVVTVNTVGTPPFTGTSGDDALQGTIGADSLMGGAGSDTYSVNHIGDKVVELANQGTDKVESTISYTLADNIENLQLMGAAEINGTGNDLNNTIIGNDVSNTLKGGAGNDILNGWGGEDIFFGDGGNDVFQFSSKFSANGDTVADFTSGVDNLDFSKIDANTGQAGDQAFVFDGYTNSDGNGHLWAFADQSAGVTHVYGKTGDFQFQVDLKGTSLSLTASNFIL